MLEASFAIPTEPRARCIPAFNTNVSIDFSIRRKSSLVNIYTLPCLSQYTTNNTLPSATVIKNYKCGCPYILIADDDSFQGFFYEVLFQRSLDWGQNGNFQTKDIQFFEVLTSGEKLLKRYEQVEACGCGRTVLVITDYNMGEANLNGIETIRSLRKGGYKGTAVLRSSEESGYLQQKHSNFKEMIKSRVVDFYVEKKEFKKIQAIVQNVVDNIMKY